MPHGGATLLVAPAFHLAGFAIWVQGMVLRMTAVPMPRFDPVGVLQAIEDHQVKQVLLVPTMIQMVVDHPEAHRHELSSVEALVYGASPISEALLDRARKLLPTAAFMQAYGMTELSPTTTILSDEDHNDPSLRRSAGRAAPYARGKIVDPADEEVPRGAPGGKLGNGRLWMLRFERPSRSPTRARNRSQLPRRTVPR